MCIDPVTALTIAGTVMSAVGAISSGQQQAAAADNAAQWADYNARRETTEAQANAAEARRTGLMRLGAARAAVGASGVLMEGSPGDAIAQSAEDVELDAQSILYQGRTRALAYGNEASRQRAGGENATQASYWTAGRNLLMGLASADQVNFRRTGQPLIGGSAA